MVEKFDGLNLKDSSDINILLLGETGVGKSTFINSIANYLHYHDLEKALKDPLFHLIPCMFNITDDNYQTHKVVIGHDNNEFQQTILKEVPVPSPKKTFIDDIINFFSPNLHFTAIEAIKTLKVGDSATQDVKTYVFPIGNGKTRLRLIDTPGMNDPRGIEQDNLNCENILSYIGQLHQLHAICFLFKPNEARVTVTFEYCFHQILSRLEKSAAENIIFIFTNAKATHYKPGETVPCLKKVVEDIAKQPPNVKIKVGENVFCFDNEAFRYLAAVKKGVDLKESKDEYSKSWKYSSEESWKLIRYILGDASRAALKPHFVNNSTSINEARRLITQLSQPLADISQLIFDNLMILDRRHKELRQQNLSLDGLKAKLYVPIINLKVIKLTQPTTVCHEESCAEILFIDGVKTWNYKQRCHDPCYLSNVPSDIVGVPQLKDCAAMDKRTQKCIRCGCPQSVHLHIYYMTEKFDDKKIDVNVQSRIDTTEKALAEAERIIGEIKRRKSELEEEKDIIINCAAKFAHFVQKNAISPINDAYRRYIEYMITREEGLGHRADNEVILHLKSLLQKYDLVKTAFEKVVDLSKHIDHAVPDVDSKQIAKEVHRLFVLKHYGKKIKELQMMQKTSRKKEHEQTEYVHASPVTKPDRQTQSDIEGDAKKKEYKKKEYKKQFVNKNFNHNKQGVKTSTVTAHTGPNEQIKIEITKSTGATGGGQRGPQNKGGQHQYFNSNPAARGNNSSHPPAYNRRSPQDNRPPHENRYPHDQNRPRYDNYRPPSDYNRPPYDNNRPHDNNRPYDNNRLYDNNCPSHDNNLPPYDNNCSPYDNSRPPHDNYRPAYDNSRPAYDHSRPSYDNHRPFYDNSRSPYDNNRPPPDNRPPYDNVRPPYDTNVPASYNQPPYDHNRPPYDDRPPHDYYRPTHDDRPSYDRRSSHDPRGPPAPYSQGGPPAPYPQRGPPVPYPQGGPPAPYPQGEPNYYGPGPNYARPNERGSHNYRDKHQPPPYESLSSHERNEKRNKPKTRDRSRPKYRSSGEKSSCNDSD